jgi:Tfp pilus assembly protein PilE
MKFLLVKLVELMIVVAIIGSNCIITADNCEKYNEKIFVF